MVASWPVAVRCWQLGQSQFIFSGFGGFSIFWGPWGLSVGDFLLVDFESCFVCFLVFIFPPAGAIADSG